MLRKIYRELVEIRKELQAVRSSLEPKTQLYTLRESDYNDLVKKAEAEENKLEKLIKEYFGSQDRIRF